MHKLYDGRQKDFEDIKNSLSTIDETEKRALQKLLTENGYEFILSNGITADNLDNLIELASKEPSPTERAISDAKEKFNQGIEGIYSAWQQSTNKQDFYNRIEQLKEQKASEKQQKIPSACARRSWPFLP